MYLATPIQFVVATIVSLAAASPLLVNRQGGPSVITGRGFQLAVRGDLRAMDPENAARNAWVLGLQRISQGLYASTIIPRDRNKTGSPVLYLDETADGEPQTLQIHAADLGSLAAYIGSREDPGEHALSFVASATDSTKGMVQYALADGIPILGGPGLGSWAVCRRGLPTGAGPISAMLPRYVYPGESAPSDCIVVDMVLLCSSMGSSAPTDGEGDDLAREIKCVAN